MSGLTVEKKERENSRQLVSRFIRGLRRSGLVYRAKKDQYNQRPLSHEMKKKAALRKEELKVKFERLEKLGKSHQK
jgi:hypothetical protein